MFWIGHGGEGRVTVVDKGDGGGRGQVQPIECPAPQTQELTVSAVSTQDWEKTGKTNDRREGGVDRTHSAGALWGVFPAYTAS